MNAVAAPLLRFRWLSFFGRPAKLYDLLCASPLIFWYAGCVYFQAGYLIRDLSSANGLQAEIFAMLDLASKLITFGFGVLLICLLIVRRAPVRKNRGLAPRIIAFLGCYVGIGALVMPIDPPHSTWFLLSMLLMVGGSGFAFYSLFWLGRSVSIMPESRKLVTSGPYSIVRHPLYLGEQAALVGVALQATSVVAPMVLTLQLCCQLYRMRYEEKVLEESFPEYTTYRSEVARIIPWLY